MGYSKSYCYNQYKKYKKEAEKWDACLSKWGKTDLMEVKKALEKEYEVGSVNKKLEKCRNKLQDAMEGAVQFRDNPESMYQDNKLKTWSYDAKLSSAHYYVGLEIDRVRNKLSNAEYNKDVWYDRYRNAEDD